MGPQVQIQAASNQIITLPKDQDYKKVVCESNKNTPHNLIHLKTSGSIIHLIEYTNNYLKK